MQILPLNEGTLALMDSSDIEIVSIEAVSLVFEYSL